MKWETYIVYLKRVTWVLFSLARISNALGAFLFFFILSVATKAPITYQLLGYGFVFSLPLVVFLNSFNDIYDFESDSINPKKGSPHNLLKTMVYGSPLAQENRQIALIAGVCAGGIILGASLLSKNPVIIGSTVFGLIAGYYYSSPPLHLKQVPLLNHLVNVSPLVLFLLIIDQLGGDISPHLAELFFSMALLMISISSLAEGADYTSDKQTGSKTMATRYGIRTSIVLALITWVLGTIISVRLLSFPYQVYLVFGCGVIVFLLTHPKDTSISKGNAILVLTSSVPILISIVRYLS